MKRHVFLGGLILAAGGLAVCASALAAGRAPDVSSAAIDAAEAWAFPVSPAADPKAAAPDLRKVLHVAGSTRSYTLGEFSFFNPPDWFPQDHPPMPRIVAHGRKPAWSCAACHLPDGEGSPASAALTGLPKAYILEQLAAFRHGLRGASLPLTTRDMAHEARRLDESDMQRAAAYFSSLPFRPRTRVVETATVPKTHWRDYVLMTNRDGARERIGARIIATPADVRDYEDRDARTEYVAYVPPGSIERGAIIAAKGVSAALPCESCHGASLQGVGNIPPLAGRSPVYIARELILFRTGERTNPGAAPMRLEASHLSVGDMIAVAAYAASRRP
jgi:cytochrome c553